MLVVVGCPLDFDDKEFDNRSLLNGIYQELTYGGQYTKRPNVAIPGLQALAMLLAAHPHTVCRAQHCRVIFIDILNVTS
jgi:hypothetical protein